MNDWVQRYIRSCLKVRAFPHLQAGEQHALDWVSVSYCAKAIVHVSTSERLLPEATSKTTSTRALHLVCDDATTDLSSIPAQWNEGVPQKLWADVLPYDEWLERVRSLPAEDNPLASLMAVFQGGFPRFNARMDSSVMKRLLEGSGIQASRPNFRPLLDYLLRHSDE